MTVPNARFVPRRSPSVTLPAPRRRAGLAGLLTSAAAAALVVAAPAAAQDAQQASSGVLQRVVIGAGREKVAIDTPQAVTVIDQEDLDTEQASSINQIFENVPGVQGAGADNPLGFAFNIRGIGATEQTASEARIAVNVDGVPKFYEQYRMGSFFSDVELYKQVEVLRGPASSTLYGSGAIGGVVNFTTKDAADFIAPGASQALRFKAGYDSNGSGWLGSVIYANRVSDSFEILGNLNYRTSDEYEDGDGTKILGSDYEAASGLIKGTWSFGNDLEQKLRFSYQRTRSDINNAPLVRTGGQSTIGVFGYVNRKVTDDTLVLAYENPFPDSPWLDIRAQIAYSDTSVEQSDHTSSSAFITCAPGTFAVLCDVEYAYKTLQLKAENVVEFSTGAWDNYLTAGIQYTRQEREAISSVGLLAFHPEGTDEKIGLYAQGEFIWNDRLTIIPGLRVDFGERSPGDGIADAADVRDTAVSPKLALHYKLTESLGIFGSLARTERMPTLDELYSADANRYPSLDLEKESADTVEVGVTFSTDNLLEAGDNLMLKGTLFHNDISDMIVSNAVVAGTLVPRYANIDNGEIWGGELEAAYTADRWFGRLAYSNITARNKDTKALLTSSPADNVSLTLGGRLPARGLDFGWRATYFDLIETSLGSFSSYDLHRLFVGWEPQGGALDGFRVDFAVENIFDATYRNNLYQDNGRGRTFKVSLTKQFDW